ncbi:phosphoesterase RecJ-like protein [Pullulanibacillus pueri]|uniref:Bifunctional oligoribonuclease and PAP phosphatase NrnA n=1 Tax=Pullulanibacillus pueri TaxID=1437324 RepID=A0A8J2ZYW9_9BACL|nr:bifunctional oligoribonuclease/PAP phosphatase NrnA [Pullulanibacillus pueri]MBM7683486.1 phosphoesterase RecJ-like protein [Pullulanibacillus pueri]GGH86723.1 bifunctional oligoribonuclease and PAP phosphatase NrnA [Pullulanibacillus pueri]
MKNKIIEMIKAYDTIIIHRHVRPDPDALGSQGGLAALIKDNFPSKKVFVVGEEVESLSFLNKMDLIEDAMYEGALVIVCDTANQARISDERYGQGDKLVKIDHHPNEDPYGDLMWVETKASSVSEMIVDLYESDPSLKMSNEAARLLYAGIIGDTGHFMFNNTTPETFKKASRLIEKSFDRQTLHDQLNEVTLKVIRFKGYVLENFELINGQVGQMRLTKDVLQTYGISPQEGSLLINSFSNVEGIKAWVFFIEEPDQIRVRLRSKGPVVNTIAARYNGGGHPMASGATVYSWEDCDRVLADLIEATQKFLEEQ